MAQPVQQDFSADKQAVMNIFPETLRSTGFRMIGMNDELGMVSFENGGEEALYAHVRQRSEHITQVSVAPGLPELNKQREAEVPAHAIGQLMKGLQDNLNP